MLGRFVSNSHLWKRSGARVMTIFRSHVGPHIHNIKYFWVYAGIWRSMRVYEGIPSAVPNLLLLLRYVQVEAVLVQVLCQVLRYCWAMSRFCCAIVELLLHCVALFLRYCFPVLRYCCAMSCYCCAIVALCCAIIALLLPYCCAMLRYFARLLCYPPKQCSALRPKKAPGGRYIKIRPLIRSFISFHEGSAMEAENL